METENTFVITPTCMDPLSVQHTWALLLMPLQLLYSPQTFSFFSLLSLVYAALFFLSSSLFFCFLFFTFSGLRYIVLSFFFFTFSCLRCTVLFFPSFLPFSSQTHKKKNQWLGQRIGCCGFVNFLGASSLEPKWLLLWALGVEGKKKGMLGLKSLVLGGNGVRGVSQQECLTCCSGMGSTKSSKKIKWWEIEKCVPNEMWYFRW